MPESKSILRDTIIILIKDTEPRLKEISLTRDGKVLKMKKESWLMTTIL